jgi:NAD(P)H dehydrogenase (quinone)
MKKIAIFIGHPIKESLSHKLALSYKKGAESRGCEVKFFSLGELKFDLILRNGYSKRQEWEPDLKKVADALFWADHWVFVTPLWWGSMTALMKGFIERVFLPGLMFKFEKNAPMPTQLMKGISARVIVTSDSPYLYYRFFIGSPVEKIFKRAILGFCGVNPVNFSYFDQVRKATPEKRDKWQNFVMSLGEKMI